MIAQYTYIVDYRVVPKFLSSWSAIKLEYYVLYYLFVASGQLISGPPDSSKKPQSLAKKVFEEAKKYCVLTF